MPYPNALAQANPQRNLLAAQMLPATGEGSYLRQQFPQVYGFLGGLAGTAPDEMQGSAMDPNTAAVRQGASYGYLPGLVASSAPLGKVGAGMGMLAGMARGTQKFDNSALMAKKFDVVKRDASEIFGAGAERFRYTDPASGGMIDVLKRPDNTASVLGLEVPEAFRGKGIGESLQSQVLQDFPAMMGQVSSKAAAKTAFRLGRRPPNQPDASLDDVFKLIDENSSVNLVSPKMQQTFNPAPTSTFDNSALTGAKFTAPQDEALRLAQQRAVKAGQSENPATRMLQQGFEPDWYHGSTGDITNFRPDLLGETTGAASAKKGFFFARDPQNPPASMTQKTTDPESINFLKRLGKTDAEIAALNSVSMAGHGAETASGYAQIGGSREYKNAMRQAKSAESRGNWDEYEKQMQIAEDSEIKRMNQGQQLVAKYGDARDEMLSKINDAIFSKQLPQKEAELLDAKIKQLMPYGWYNSYSNPQMENLQKELVNLVGKDSANTAIDKIKKFQSVRNERVLIEKTQEGGNVMPVALRYKNPMVHDFAGNAYRDQTYSDLMDQALFGGHDALIMKNTFDPGGSPSKLVDVGVVFSPDQIRSRFAAFDPLRKTAAIAAAAGLAAPDLLAGQSQQQAPQFDNSALMK